MEPDRTSLVKLAMATGRTPSWLAFGEGDPVVATVPTPEVERFAALPLPVQRHVLGLVMAAAGEAIEDRARRYRTKLPMVAAADLPEYRAAAGPARTEELVDDEPVKRIEGE